MSHPSTSLTHTLLVPSVVHVSFVESPVDLDPVSLDLVLVRPQAPDLEADQVFAEALEVEGWALSAVYEMVGVDVDE